ncbi:histidine phosphatase family protein [Paenibacillus sp. LHD-117]|uniref:histidine phosphatase family protein n=1 Tax=Paenibacillus sp. LHD-117 TaxID=3071412 RepID=UPI0027DED636|nr:histidine phosphatase family protein [Paenibacillus sp. LHD-117]MDQ6421765.1 histidine phosphatase family protein [Paenibacillus sp. LHD-117]
MKNIFLVRHCKADGQDPLARLTDEGRVQAKQIAEFFKNESIDEIITSTFKRAIDSISPLCDERNLDYSVDTRLEEKVLSSLKLDNWMELLKESFDQLDIVYEGGESSKAAMNRGIEVIHEIMNGLNQNVVVVTHGALMTLIMKYFDNSIGYEEWRNLTNPDIYLLKIDDTNPMVERIWK